MWKIKYFEKSSSNTIERSESDKENKNPSQMTVDVVILDKLIERNDLRRGF